jgi:[ribosomal protein S5]-alanine N-acetyltransferase
MKTIDETWRRVRHRVWRGRSRTGRAGRWSRKVLEPATRRARAEFLSAVARSGQLHRGLVAPPRTPAAFHAYLQRLRRPNQAGYWVRTPDGALAGVVNLSEIVLGPLRSAYLGYYAFTPFNGHGHMRRGVDAALTEAFRTHRLHRVEANIQPGNDASRALVRRLGFRLEGYSPRYLKVCGRWRDHERWALTLEDWRARGRMP